MGLRAMLWALDADIPNTGAKFVLVSLGEHANGDPGQDFTCYPSIERIQEHTSQGFRTVQRHLDWLWSAGWISREKRRARAGGNKGVYDYTLHQDPERRKQLVEARKSAEAPANLAGDATGQSVPTDRPNSTDEPANLACAHNDEPVIEPVIEPGAGEDEENFQAVFDAWAAIDPYHLSRPKAWAEWTQWAEHHGSAALRHAAMRYLAEDPDVRRTGPRYLHNWLSEERWRPLLPSQHRLDQEEPQTRTPFAGPADLRDAIVERKGEDWVRSWIDRCGWDPENRKLIPRGPTAAGRIRQDVGAVLKSFGADVGEPCRVVA
jgi:hypothetical protein